MSHHSADRPHRPPTEAEVRRRRQAEALRANLTRRKAQARARAGAAVADPADTQTALTDTAAPAQLRDRP